MEWIKNHEPGASRFFAVLRAAQAGEVQLLLSTINRGEVFYNCWNEWDKATAEEVLRRLHRVPLLVVHPTEDDVMAAARVKAEYKIAYADAFAAVLAIQFAAPVLTGDRDFLRLRDAGVLTLHWLGA
jgi:predicted nucleic acid-binding protein